MNNRRKEDRREAIEYAQANPMPEINRAHRDCERECIELRSRVKQLEGLLAFALPEIQEYIMVYPFGVSADHLVDWMNSVDAMLHV